MKRSSSIFFLTAMMLLAVTLPEKTFAADDNIYIAELAVNVELSVRDGRVSRGKVSENYKMSARRVAGSALLAAFYDSNSEVSHASSNGGKPQYRAWESDDLFYTGSRVCLLPVDVKPGKFSTAKVEQIYPKAEYINDIILPSPLYDIAHESVTVTIPAEVAGRVTVRLYNGTGRERMTRESDAGGNVTVKLTVDSLKAIESEPLMPEIMTCLPILTINAAFGDMDELYAYLREKLEDPDARYATIDELARNIAREAGTGVQDRIDAVAHWVRNNIRYVAIEHGELAHRPDSAVSVLQKRYGDCKGSANLICALLRSLGIDGRRAWIGTKGGVTAPFSDLPTLSAANHMIAAAVVGDSIIYLDGTVSCAPRGFVPESLAGQECLIENGDSYILTRVGEACPLQSIMKQTGRLAVGGSSLHGRLRYRLGGAWHAMIGSALNSVTASRRSWAFGQILAGNRKSISLDSAELLSHNTFRTDSSEIVAKFNDSEGVKAVAGRSKLYVMPRLLRLSLPQTVDARNRRFDIISRKYYPLEADVIIELPQGYEASGLPFVGKLDNPWFEGEMKYEAVSSSEVRCRARLTRRRTVASAAEAEAWNNAVREVEKLSNSALILTRISESSQQME